MRVSVDKEVHDCELKKQVSSATSCLETSFSNNVLISTAHIRYDLRTRNDET